MSESTLIKMPHCWKHMSRLKCNFFSTLVPSASNEPVSNIKYKLACAYSEDSNQSATTHFWFLIFINDLPLKLQNIFNFQGGTSVWIFYVFVLSYVCYVFVRVCLFVLCGHLLGKG